MSATHFRRRSLAAVWMTASALALAAGTAVAQQAAVAPSGTGSQAPSPTSSATATNEVVVTGTRIHGVAPVGSSIVVVDQADIQRAGLSSTANLLDDVPSVLTLGTGNGYLGGAAQDNDGVQSLGYTKSPNLRGLGAQATLSLVNGHRMAYQGASMDEFDPDDYPVQMISHIDVVEDGTSPLYGSDAIAGTVNYVLRSPENTFETYSGYGTARGQDTWYATGILGRAWSSGGFIASYEHDYQSALPASADAAIYNDNFTPYGGVRSPDYAGPGNVIVGGVDYAIPTGQNGQNLTLSQLGAPGVANRQSAWTGIDAIPQETADRVALNFNQDITSWLQLFGDGLYSRTTYFLDNPLSTPSTNITASIPDSNPFSPCNPSHYGGGAVTGPAALVAACKTGTLLVHYSELYDSGPNVKYGEVQTWDLNGGLRATLPFGWKASLTAGFGVDEEPSHTNYFHSPAFPAGTYNVFCDPLGYTCNPSSVTSTRTGATPMFIYSQYRDQNYELNADGPLISLPGGEVRLAVGAEYYNGDFISENNNGAYTQNSRDVSSVYGELYIPVVGPSMGVPGVYKLELDVAGRIDKYSDVGTTSNPKIGINWWPTDDLKLHASYGTSFDAPGLAYNDPYTTDAILPSVAAGVSSAICAACSGVISPAVYYTVGGANHTLTPERSTSYSVGGDWNPKAIPGLSASVNYWWISYENQVLTPVYNAGAIGAINQQIYNKYIIYNPTYFPALAANNPVAFFGSWPTINQSNANCSTVYGKQVTTQALFNTMLACLNANGFGSVLGAPTTNPASLLAFEDGRHLNSGSTVGHGLDLSLYYKFSNGMGRWRVGGVGEYIMDWNVATLVGAPVVDEVNNFLYPLAFRARGELSWNQKYDFGGLALSGFVNFQNAYHMPATLLPAGVSSAYTHIDSNTTVDLTATYTTPSTGGPWIAREVTFAVSVQNLFDQKPPLVINAGGSSGPGVLFDPANGSSLGRVIQIQIGKKW